MIYCNWLACNYFTPLGTRWVKYVEWGKVVQILLRFFITYCFSLSVFVYVYVVFCCGMWDPPSTLLLSILLQVITSHTTSLWAGWRKASTPGCCHPTRREAPSAACLYPNPRTKCLVRNSHWKCLNFYWTFYIRTTDQLTTNRTPSNRTLTSTQS